jgi:dipeptidyl aminopeptidase/acylaminoacyl peptidase
VVIVFELDFVAQARNLEYVLFGGSPAVERAASSVTYVCPHDPPFLILQGTADMVIPPAQSRELAQRLQAADVSVTLVMVQGGPHGRRNPAESPNPFQLARIVAKFFITTLAPGSVRG